MKFFFSSVLSFTLLASSFNSAHAATMQCKSEGRNVHATLINPDSYYPESPQWVDGRLYYVEFSKDRVMVWDPKSGNTEFWKSPGCGPAAVLHTPTGEFWVTCYNQNALVRISASGKELKPNLPTSPGPNDFSLDAQGGFYYTTSGEFTRSAPIEGRVYYHSRSGIVQEVASGIHYANGLAVVNNSRSLLVSEHLENRILQFKIEKDGTLSERKVVIDLRPFPGHLKDITGLIGPDGMRASADDSLYIAQYGAARVMKFDLSSPTPKFIGMIRVHSTGDDTEILINQTNIAVMPGRIFGSLLREKPDLYPGFIYQISDATVSRPGDIDCWVH